MHVADTRSSQHRSALLEMPHAQPKTSCRDKRLCKHTPVYHRRHHMHHRPRSPLSQLMNCELVVGGGGFLPWNKLANDSEQKYCGCRPPPRLCPHDCSGIFMQMAPPKQQRCNFQLYPSFSPRPTVRSGLKFPADGGNARAAMATSEARVSGQHACCIRPPPLGSDITDALKRSVVVYYPRTLPAPVNSFIRGDSAAT